MGGSNEPLDSLPHKKLGRSLLLGEKIDRMVKAYIKSVCEAGGSVYSQVVIAAARGILTSLHKIKLQEFGGHIDLTRQWTHSFLTRMNYVQRKGTTAKSKYSEANFAEKKKGRIESNSGDRGNPTRINPELGPNRDQVGSINWLDNGRTGSKKGLTSRLE